MKGGDPILPPNAKLGRLVDAAEEPVSLVSMKQYLRLENDADDEIVSDLISAARLVCEGLCDRSFITTTWKLTLDYLPFSVPGGVLGGSMGGWPSRYPGRVSLDDGGIVLPMPPLIAVTSIVYVDQGGSSATLSPSSAIVSPGTPGRVYPAFGTYFPFAQPRASAVEIVYTAGYGPTAADVPRNVAQAVRMLAAHYYAHRSEQAPIPDAVANLLGPSRWGGYA
jgi:hypothetical protein